MKLLYWSLIPVTGLCVSFLGTRALVSITSQNENQQSMAEKLRSEKFSILTSSRPNHQKTNHSLEISKVQKWTTNEIDRKNQQMKLLASTETLKRQKFERLWQDFEQQAKPILANISSPDAIEKEAISRQTQLQKEMDALEKQREELENFLSDVNNAPGSLIERIIEGKTPLPSLQEIESE